MSLTGCPPPPVTLQIKADQEGAAGRSYNYRVVMHTGGAELDMRGRCSAGQKVGRPWGAGVGRGCGVASAKLDMRGHCSAGRRCVAFKFMVQTFCSEAGVCVVKWVLTDVHCALPGCCCRCWPA